MNTAPASPDETAFRARLRDFLHACAASAPCEEADRIIEALRLLHAAPPGGRIAPLPASRTDAIAALVAHGAAESAVLALIGPDTAFMLSRGGNGVCLATIVLPGESEEAIAEGSTAALALLCAHLSALLCGTARDQALFAAAPLHAGARLN